MYKSGTYKVGNLLERAATDDRDGPPSGYGGNLPPRASFFAARSLSLVLADFGTLLFCFFLVVIFYSLSFFVLFLRCNHRNFQDYQNSCQPFKSEQRAERIVGI